MTATGISYSTMKCEYFYADSIGMWIEVDVTSRSITSIRFTNDTGNRDENRISLPVTKDLQRYFQGEQVEFFSYNVDLSDCTPFQQEVLTAVRSIPYGTCITYSQLARMIGKPRAIRAVGNALGKNRVPVIIPCHRIISTRGAGGFSYGVEIKRALLGLESIMI